MTIITHPIRFFFRKDFPVRVSREAILMSYVDDLNYVLSKTTDRRFVFASLHYVDQMPTSTGSNLHPTTNYEYHVYVRPTATLESQGGGSAGNQDGQAVCFDCAWDGLHWPLDVDTNGTLTAYWWQIHVMLHEWAHCCGAGLGEYYKIWRVADSTGVEPLRGIDGSDPLDPFWALREDYKTDPLLAFGAGNAWWTAKTRQELLDKVQYGLLTSAIINGHYRNTVRVPWANVNAAKVRVTDPNGAPLVRARVRVWHVDKDQPKSRLLTDTFTDADGIAPWSWHEVPLPELSVAYSESVRCIKVHHPLYEPSVGYVTIYDAQWEALNGNFDFTVECPMTPLEGTAPIAIKPFRLEILPNATIRVHPATPSAYYTLLKAPSRTGPWLVDKTYRADADTLYLPIQSSAPSIESSTCFFMAQASLRKPNQA